MLFADDILLLAPSVASLQRILSICEAELDWVDMRINPKKSLCIRFGARFRVECSSISTSDDSILPFSDNFRYLGVYLRSSRSTACSFSHAMHSMYRAFNAVFGKVGRIASPNVVVQLVKTKCLPILCYDIEVCPVRDIRLKETVEECMTEFNVSIVNDVIDARKRRFLAKYSVSENSLCQVFARADNLR